jgi:hypothetical protein
MSSNRDKFWADNINILLQKNRLTYFFPNNKLSVVENLNAIVRLCLYLTIILILYTRNSKYVLLPIGAMVLTYLIYNLHPNKKELNTSPIIVASLTCKSGCKEPKKRVPDKLIGKVEKECVKPNIDNPFMNLNTITDDYKRPPACKAFLYDTEETEELKKEITDSFNHNLYRDVSDLYSKNNSQRQFFTMPWTSWPNDQTSFAKWNFSTGPTCKEIGLKCAPYWDPSASNSVLEN